MNSTLMKQMDGEALGFKKQTATQIMSKKKLSMTRKEGVCWTILVIELRGGVLPTNLSSNTAAILFLPRPKNPVGWSVDKCGQSTWGDVSCAAHR
jgi:hypothetical protein